MSGSSKRIKDLAPSERPLEKLVEKGTANLTDIELLALLLGSGRKGKNSIGVARTILQSYTPQKLSTVDLRALQKVSGVGKMKAARILAAIELGKRLFSTTTLSKTVIHGVSDILPLVREFIDKKQEYISVFYLNARHEVVQREIIAIGSLNMAAIEPRDIFRAALLFPCTGFILVHNHPSGDPAPSEDDIAFTKHIQQAGELMGVLLLDHIIVANRGYFSFKEGQ